MHPVTQAMLLREALSTTRMSGPELWNTTQVAEFLGVKPGTVSAYRHRGQMPEPARTIGTQTHLWEADTIRKWQESRKNGEKR